MDVKIVETGPDDTRLGPLLAELRAELDARYPEEIDFEHPELHGAARFALAVSGDEAVGCCAVQPLGDGWCEIKRMYVRPAARGLGIAGRIVAEVERTAARMGAHQSKLETGTRQPEAITVYERAGFHRIPNYPPYHLWDMSICYAKSLTSQGTAPPG